MSQDSIDPILQVALAHHTAGRLPEAQSLYRQILARHPSHAQTWHLLGVVAGQSGRPDIAVDLISRAIAISPFEPVYFNSLGLYLCALGKLDESIAACQKAIALNADYAEAHNNLGNALKDSGRLRQAIVAFEQAVRLKPDLAEAHSNLAAALCDDGEHERALLSAHRSIEIKPQYHGAHNTLGMAQFALGRFDEALASFRRALTLKPDMAEAHMNLGFLLLEMGCLPEGWPEYEWRWKTAAGMRFDPRFPRPLWDGRNLAGQRILLHAEQGFGDTLQFVRYIPLVAQRGGKITIACQKELKLLLTSMPDIEKIAVEGDHLGEFDIHCPLLTLPRVFATTLDTIPAHVPYLQPKPEAAKFWKHRLSDRHGLKVGLAWAGSARNKINHSRSIPFSQFSPLAKIPGITLYSLQKGDAATQAHGAGIIDWTSELHDFSDTAALIQNLDLIISVETAVCHLAGALAKPTWVLLPHIAGWRWMRDRLDSPWYPTMRLFRQPTAKDWPGVIAQVTRALTEFAPTPSRSPANEPTNTSRPAV